MNINTCGQPDKKQWVIYKRGGEQSAGSVVEWVETSVWDDLWHKDARLRGKLYKNSIEICHDVLYGNSGILKKTEGRAGRRWVEDGKIH